MPTVFRIDDLRAVIYLNDHRPAHVHVLGRGGEAVFLLNCPEGPPELRESYGFGLREVRRIELSLVAHLRDACEDWTAIHGDT